MSIYIVAKQTVDEPLVHDFHYGSCRRFRVWQAGVFFRRREKDDSADGFVRRASRLVGLLTKLVFSHALYMCMARLDICLDVAFGSVCFGRYVHSIVKKNSPSNSPRRLICEQ